MDLDCDHHFDQQTLKLHRSLSGGDIFLLLYILSYIFTVLHCHITVDSEN